MKRIPINKVNIVAIVIFLILLSPFFYFFIAIYFHIGWTTNGPYHHAALVNVQKTINYNDRILIKHNGKLYEIKDDNYEQIELDLEGKSIHNVMFYNEKLYISNFSNLFVLNKNLEIEEKINVGAFSFFIDDNYIYFTNNNKKYDFYAYNLKSKESKLISANLRNSTYLFNDKLIYVNDYGNIYDITDTTCFTSISGTLFNNGKIRTGDYAQSFYINSNTGTVYWKNNKLNITYGQDSYELELNTVHIVKSPVHIESNKIIFSTFEYLDHDNCNSHLGCICRYGSSYIWSFDIETKTITKLKTFDTGTVLINFSETSYCYYKDGKIYQNDQVIKEINLIEPYGEYIQKGDAYFVYDSRVSDSYFYDDGKTIYYRYFNYKDSLKNQYFN